MRVRSGELSLRLIDALCVTLVILQVLDFCTTYFLLSNCDFAYEANALMRAVLDRSYFLAFALKISVTVALVGVSALWVRGKLQLPLHSVIADFNLKLEKAFGLDKIESRKTLVFYLLLLCNIFYIFVVTHNTVAIALFLMWT